MSSLWKRIVVLGLSLSSSWGNGHATTWRALLKGLAGQDHEVLFLERNVPWYAENRDLPSPDFCRLEFYDSLEEIERFRTAISSADAVIVGSYVPDGIVVAERACSWARGVKAFYDIDTPVTVADLDAGRSTYLAPDLISRFDLYLSFTGGPLLEALETKYGARCARQLYCSVDPAIYKPRQQERRWDLGYLGTYSADRQPALERLLLEPARRLPAKRFVVAGPQYPDTVEWPANVERIDHLPPGDHPVFYSSLGWTLNITRTAMRDAGFSPSVRLFEAAACGVPIITDQWAGIETAFDPTSEIRIVERGEDVMNVLSRSEGERTAQSAAAHRRVLREHTGWHRAQSLANYLDLAILEKGRQKPLSDLRPRTEVMTDVVRR